jgi:membrane protein
MNKIKQYFFYKDGEFSWWKSIQNILLIYVVSYLIWLYYNSFYNSSVTRISFDFRGSAIGIILASILCYTLIIIICILSTFCFKNTILKILIRLFNLASFVVILFCYGFIVDICGNPICFLNPFVFPAVAWAFILIFKKSKYFTPFFTILFLIPASIIITDDWIGAPSVADCKQNISKASFSSITLSTTYFHQDNGKTIWQPNIVFPVDLEKEYENKILYVPSSYCSEGTMQLRKKYKENNIILCVYKDAKKIIISTFDKNKQILVDLKFTKFNRKRNNLDLILHTTKGEYSCAEKLSTDFIIKHIPYKKYLIPAVYSR